MSRWGYVILPCGVSVLMVLPTSDPLRNLRPTVTLRNRDKVSPLCLRGYLLTSSVELNLVRPDPKFGSVTLGSCVGKSCDGIWDRSGVRKKRLKERRGVARFVTFTLKRKKNLVKFSVTMNSHLQPSKGFLFYMSLIDWFQGLCMC